ncbi:MAG: ATP-binding protein [Candidatus Binatia bacterium]
MVQRRFWIDRVLEAWSRRSVVWLSGVRRVGKTFLSQSLENVEYFDCELPRTRRILEDPEAFLGGLGGRRVVLDEIHRLDDPSELLKIAADHYPGVAILATGSSTLGASAKFRDTLSGRKSEIWLTPMIHADLADFGKVDLERRLLRGGLPPFFLTEAPQEREFQEWVDAFWAKDIQELFRLERRSSFQRFFELLMAQSGGIFEASRFARPCEVSRQTIANYLAVLEATFVAHVVRPFTTRRGAEIISAPRVYAFDTGFVCYHRGWDRLRPDDRGPLWEHLVLNELQARTPGRDIRYWRTKHGREIDFVLRRRGGGVAAIECKWSANTFEVENLLAFRNLYPRGENLVVASDVAKPFTRSYDDASVRFVGLNSIAEELATPGSPARHSDRRP